MNTSNWCIRFHSNKVNEFDEIVNTKTLFEYEIQSANGNVKLEDIQKALKKLNSYIQDSRFSPKLEYSIEIKPRAVNLENQEFLTYADFKAKMDEARAEQKNYLEQEAKREREYIVLKIREIEELLVQFIPENLSCKGGCESYIPVNISCKHSVVEKIVKHLKAYGFIFTYLCSRDADDCEVVKFTFYIS